MIFGPSELVPLVRAWGNLSPRTVATGTRSIFRKLLQPLASRVMATVLNLPSIVGSAAIISARNAVPRDFSSARRSPKTEIHVAALGARGVEEGRHFAEA